MEDSSAMCRRTSLTETRIHSTALLVLQSLLRVGKKLTPWPWKTRSSKAHRLTTSTCSPQWPEGSTAVPRTQPRSREDRGLRQGLALEMHL